jgi:peptidoglycan/xylan/chitin deacetylase (PgdA/CDA1 family)
MIVCLTIDLEPDCPPFLEGWRGASEGMPRLLDLLEREGVATTVFSTGETAERFGDLVTKLVAGGHELGCHGQTHTAFTRLSEKEADREIITSSARLRTFAPVTAFRAPYLRFPERYLPLLERHGFTVDSSQGVYKPREWFRRPEHSRLRRVPASITSSVLRLPRAVRDPILASLASPVVLFVHPWEFVDLTREKLPRDCRFRTGEPALRCLGEVIRFYRDRGARFTRLGEVGTSATP